VDYAKNMHSVCVNSLNKVKGYLHENVESVVFLVYLTHGERKEEDKDMRKISTHNDT